MTGHHVKPLYPSLPVSFVAIPFIWNFLFLMAGLFAYDATKWSDSSTFSIGLIVVSCFLAVIFYLPSRRHILVEEYFSAQRISPASLWAAIQLAIGLLLLINALVHLGYWLMAAAGYDLRYDWVGDSSASFPWDDCIFFGLVLPLSDGLLLQAVVLRGLLDYYRPWRAVCLSATLFALAHWFLGRPIEQFALGCISGILFVRTRSAWVVVLASSLGYLFREWLAWNGTKSIVLDATVPAEQAVHALTLTTVMLLGAVLAWRGWRKVNTAFPPLSESAGTPLCDPKTSSDFKARRAAPPSESG